MGSLRLAVSPNIYPLEMNLARESFIRGSACMSFFDEVCRLLDETIHKDLSEELVNKKDILMRSTIASRYSASMMNAWVGNVASPSFVLSSPISGYESVSYNPWPKLTNLMMDELTFILLDKSGKRSPMNISSLVSCGDLVFATGVVQDGISSSLLEQIFDFAPSSKLIIGLPDVGFGIQELRLWAKEEILLPVPKHCRSAFSLRFGGERPFSFYPRECDHLAISSVSSVPQFAVVDYRDLMAEIKDHPTGSDKIVGVLNRKHLKVRNLLDELIKYKSVLSLKRIAYTSLKKLKETLTLGSNNLYNQNCREDLRDSLNEFINVLRMNGATNLKEFEIADFPEYFDGGQVTPFGGFGLSAPTIQTLKEVSVYGESLYSLS